MPNKNYKSINIDPTAYAIIRRLAEQNHRTIGGQVSAMAETFEIMHISSVTTLPHPPDSEPVPLVTITS